MCTADIAQRGIFSSHNSVTPAARSAMKLPRCNAIDTSAVSNTRARNQEGRTAALRASAARSHAAPSSCVRRCHSTTAGRRPRGVASGTTVPSVHKSKSRSCSQEASNCNNRSPPRTKVLPVPPYDGGRDRFSSSHSVDKNDLARMYDYATWNMYERIVSARRRRLSQMGSKRPSTTEHKQPAGPRTNEPASSQVASRRDSDGNKQQQPLYKASSQDESTTTTTGETDKSSTTSSSWSRTDSPGPFPDLSFPMVETRDVKSCPPPALEHGDNEDNEDQFIFQLDM